jgi:hypothetical protein
LHATNDKALQTAVGALALTSKLVDDAITRIPTSQWLERPAPHLNHVLWIIGHLAVTRGVLVCTLGRRSEPLTLDSLFSGGTPAQEAAAYPSPSIVIDAWREMAVRLDQALKAAVVSDLERPSPEGVPTLNGCVSGALAASVFHEAYHVGQLGYLTRWLGHAPLLGR